MFANILVKAALLSLVAITGVQAGYTVILYEDNDCETPVPGWGYTEIASDSCGTGVSTGWSSAAIQSTDNNNHPDDTIWFYTQNNCDSNSGQYLKTFPATTVGCMNDFGFVANAIGDYSESFENPQRRSVGKRRNLQ